MRPPVRGLDLDPQTRCAHWHSDLDVIAIKMACCGTYYACHDCHAALAGHPPRVWAVEEFDEPAVLCGACGTELSVSAYLACGSRCPHCGAGFNPGCHKHRRLYFAAG
ncbi:CHY zinc finger protein [Phenylobacterium sp.]|uniref:CHY zinc finger protein n=1 Tax=Phenylobacterium sp. TaxID=1871053 RepID=UPI0025FCF824|nr:CHY zinc finger protein [Phenylobacterium sp.]